MEQKVLKKIKRKELLELMLEQTKRIKELEEELEKTKLELNSKNIKIEESGSIAEAALKLNNMFEDAQKSIEQYVSNVKEKCENTLKDAQLERERIINEANNRVLSNKGKTNKTKTKVSRKKINKKSNYQKSGIENRK